MDSGGARQLVLVGLELGFVAEVVIVVGLEIELGPGPGLGAMIVGFVSAEIVAGVSVAEAEVSGWQAGAFVAGPEPAAYAETDSAEVFVV